MNDKLMGHGFWIIDNRFVVSIKAWMGKWQICELEYNRKRENELFCVWTTKANKLNTLRYVDCHEKNKLI